jgi:signal transduction histidine kinase
VTIDSSRPRLVPASELGSGSAIALGDRARAPASPVLPEDPGFSIGRFKVEAAGLILLLLTFAAIQFQELFTHKTIHLTPTNRTYYAPYAYDDKGNGGNSSIQADFSSPLRWSCDLGTAYQYPFCGYGLLFDQGGNGEGRDLTQVREVTIRFKMTGPAEKLRLIVKNADARYGVGETTTKPNEIEVPAVQGEQTVRVDLNGLSVPPWWIDQFKIPKALGEPQRDNVTAIELQPGSGSKPGHYDFAVESISLEGRQLSQAQYYLILLVGWAALIAGLLVYRVLGIRRKFESRHRRQQREAHELQFARAVAERSSAAKSAFLANMSHELRTPLNAILGYAQLLEQSGLGERDETAVRTIRQSGTHLLTLITDILDLSKIEAGRLELDPAPFDLHACVTGVGDMMRIRAAEKGLAFTASVGPEVAQRILGDEKRLRQVLINLLGNAMKFTHAGEVSLRVSGIAAPAGRHGVRVEVRDTGVGMGEDDLVRIFEPFEQAGKAGQRAGGTGLGLSISRQIVALMGGAINVESHEGQGSRFWFDLQLEPAEPALAAPRAAALPAPKLPVSAAADDVAGAIVPPPGEQLDALLALAQAGNMRAIRAFADDLAARHPENAGFAERLKSLASGYQSRAILELVSRCAEQKEAA